MTPRITREEGQTWVDGVPDIRMTGPWMRLKGMEILLRHRGEDPGFDDLLVYSGEAFHLCHGTKWELRTGLCMPAEPWSLLAEACGYEARWTRPSTFFEMDHLEPEERWQRSEAFLEELRGSIDHGRPLLLGGAYGRCDTWRVVVGFDPEDGKICYVGGDEAYEWTDLIDDKVEQLGFWDMQVRGAIDRAAFGCGGWLANAAFLLGGRKKKPSGRDKVRAGLKRAVDLFRAEPFETPWFGGVKYAFGEKAYEAWAEDLAALAYPADVEKPRPDVPEIYDMSHLGGQARQIAEGRGAAAAFCERAAGVLPKAEKPLRAAARAYREEAETARKAFGVFLDGSADRCRAWLADAASREGGVAAIRDMLAKERQAVKQVEAARKVAAA